MGLHVPNLPDAAPGIPKGRVAPDHGPETRIDSGDSRAVVQPQSVRRLAEFVVRTPERDSPCTSTPMSVAHLRIGNGLHPTAVESGLRTRGSKHTVDHSFMTGRYEADPHLDEAGETAVEAVLGRTVIHAPEDVLEALDSAPGGCDGHGAYGWVIEPLRGSEAVSGQPRRHFGASTGHRIAQNRRSPVSEGYG